MYNKGFDNSAQFSPRRKLMEAASRFGDNPRIKQLLQEADRRFCFNAADPYLSSVDRNSNEWIIWSHYQSLFNELSVVTSESTKDGAYRQHSADVILPEQTIPLTPLDGQISYWEMEPNLPNDAFINLNIEHSSIVDKQPPLLLADQNSTSLFNPSLSLAPTISPDYGQGTITKRQLSVHFLESQSSTSSYSSSLFIDPNLTAPGSGIGSSRTTNVLDRSKCFDNLGICKKPEPYNTPLSSCDESQTRAILRNAKSTTSKRKCREDGCFSIFTLSKDEKMHFKTEHRDKTTLCSRCNKSFTRKDSMKKHSKERCKLRPQPEK